jgi:hypothetical protein
VRVLHFDRLPVCVDTGTPLTASCLVLHEAQPLVCSRIALGPTAVVSACLSFPLGDEFR